MDAQDKPIRFLRHKKVTELTGLSRGAIYRAISEGRFPHARKLTPTAVGWLETEVQAWLAERAASLATPTPARTRRAQKARAHREGKAS